MRIIAGILLAAGGVIVFSSVAQFVEPALGQAASFTVAIAGGIVSGWCGAGVAMGD